MVNRNLLRQFDPTEDELQDTFAAESWLPEDPQVFEANKIVRGKVLSVNKDIVCVDVGFKSEGRRLAWGLILRHSTIATRS